MKSSYRQVKKVFILLCLSAALVVSLGSTASCKTTYRYTTQTVKLSQELKVNHNTKVKLIKNGKKCVVEYKGERYKVSKKFLNAEGLPSAKKAKAYIRKLKRRNPVRWRGRKYTYYTSRRFPVHRLTVKGLHLDKNGMWCDKDGYIVLGSSRANRAKRKVFATPFGKYGKVYDTGGVSTPSTLCDVATSW